MNQDELEKIKTRLWENAVDNEDVSSYWNWAQGFDCGVEALQKELDEAVEVIRLIALTENNNYLAKEFLAKVKRG
jgi:hypothetical protein